MPYTRPQGMGRLGELFATVRVVAFDFDGVFTDNMVYVTQEGIESVRCWRSDGIGLSRLRGAGVEPLILSTEVNPVVGVRAKKLKAECRQGIEDKAATIMEFCRERGVDPSQAAFVGNDVNDIPALKIAGFAVTVADGHPLVKQVAHYTTAARGGEHAIRELCEYILTAQGHPINY